MGAGCWTESRREDWRAQKEMFPWTGAWRTGEYLAGVGVRDYEKRTGRPNTDVCFKSFAVKRVRAIRREECFYFVFLC